MQVTPAATHLFRIMQFLCIVTGICVGSTFGQFSTSAGNLDKWTTSSVSRDWSWSDADGQLRKVRAARNRGFDRVVFEFADDVPVFSIRYVEAPILGADDKPVHINGKAFIEVRFRCYYAENSIDKIFKGYPQGELNLPALLEVEDTYLFEALQIYVLGTRSQKPFRVQRMSSPARLVIDIKH